MEHVESGLVCSIPGPLFLHPPEWSHGNLSVGLATPRTTPVLQLHQFVGGLIDKQLNGVLIDKPVPAGDRVEDVIFETVMVLDDCRRTTLSGHRVAAHRIDLADQRDF